MDVKALNRGFTLFWLALIGILSLLPGKTFEDLGYDFFGADKFVHAFLYYFLARSLIKTSEGFGKKIPPSFWLWPRPWAGAVSWRYSRGRNSLSAAPATGGTSSPMRSDPWRP